MTAGTATATDLHARREIAVLADGPWARHCYWRHDLEAMQAASRAVGYPDDHPCAVLRRYRPTHDHDGPTDGAGPRRLWRYRAPTPAVAAAPIAPTTSTSPAGSPRRRVLITGSRTWTDPDTIRTALADVWGDGTAVLVHGGCPRGADALADTCWKTWGGTVERHPADWARHGRAAGPRRNTAMVAAHAEVCLAFIRDHSPGATHTAALAQAAGIPTRRYHR